MTQTGDPIADRAAQLEAAYAAYSTAMDTVRAEQKRQTDQAAEAARAAEVGLFEQYRERVERITGETATGPAPEPTIGAQQEAADIEESGM